MEIQSASASVEMGEEEYIVEVYMKKCMVGGKLQYLLRRKRYENTNTWELVENLGSVILIDEFERQWDAREEQRKSEEAAKQNKEEVKQPLVECKSDNSTGKESRGGEIVGNSTQPTGFDRGLEAEAIIDAAHMRGEKMFLMKWKEQEELSLVPATLANVKCPQVVITFYQQRFLWRDGDRKDSCQELTPAQQVLQFEPLLDEILQFALADDDVERLIKTTKACKLVQRLWLSRVCAPLQKSPPDWFTVGLNLTEDPDRAITFISTFADSLETSIPPFNLNCHFGWTLTERTWNTLLYCLIRYGAALRQLDLDIVTSRLGNSRTIFSWLHLVPLRLPKLEIVEIVVDRQIFERGICNKNQYEQIKCFVQTVLAATESVNQFDLHLIREEETNWPVIIENLELPPTLTTIDFTMRTGLFAQLLMENFLPHLTSLTMLVFTSADEDESIFADSLMMVLEKFRTQLKRLEIQVDEDFEGPESESINRPVVLPAMECLVEFKWDTRKTEWSIPPSTSLDNHFPVLRKITLNRHTHEMLRKYFDNSKTCSVLEVSVHIGNMDGVEDDHDFKYVQQMQRLSQTFPNVVKLEVTTSYTYENSHIKFIFQTMRQLQELKIVVEGFVDEDDFISILLGVNTEENPKLRAQIGKLWKTSIREHMPALRKLEFRGGIDESLFSSLSWNLEL